MEEHKKVMTDKNEHKMSQSRSHGISGTCKKLLALLGSLGQCQNVSCKVLEKFNYSVVKNNEAQKQTKNK